MESISATDKSPITADKPPINSLENSIIEYVKSNGSITNSEACEILGLKSSRVKEILRNMVSAKLLSAVGERKSRRYTLPNE